MKDELIFILITYCIHIKYGFTTNIHYHIKWLPTHIEACDLYDSYIYNTRAFHKELYKFKMKLLRNVS
jgi:hypothetical protein